MYRVSKPPSLKTTCSIPELTVQIVTGTERTADPQDVHSPDIACPVTERKSPPGNEKIRRQDRAGGKRHVRHAEDAGVELASLVVGEIDIAEELKLLVDPGIVACAEVERMLGS